MSTTDEQQRHEKPAAKRVGRSGKKRYPNPRAIAMNGEGPIAALDLGTNNCRLLVARPDGRNFVVMDAFSRAVRLGEGVEGTNILSEDAQVRALKALRICAGKIRHHRVGDARFVATEACRRALNGRAFVRRVVRETGLSMDIISAEEEARFAVAGCAPLINIDAHQLLVFDIGGGSTELIWIDMSGTPPARREKLVRALAPIHAAGGETATARAAAAHICDWISVPLGVSILHDRYSHIKDDSVRFAHMAQHFGEQLEGFGPPDDRKRAGDGALQIVGVSGTATTFGALYQGLTTYDRSKVDGLWLPMEGASAVASELVSMDRRGRALHPGIGRGRSELVVSGAAIMMTILERWPVSGLRIADRGLREGMLYGLMQAREDRQP